VSILDLFAEEPAPFVEMPDGSTMHPMPEAEPQFDTITDEEQLERDWGAPPFSVLRQASGPWQKRKKAWAALGIESHLGRDQNLLPTGKNSVYSRKFKGYGNIADAGAAMKAYANGQAWDEGEEAEAGSIADSTSIFDPALAELAYSWFCPRGGMILDPFAGGSVRGIVAGYMGHPYLGVDLRQEQVVENERQRDRLWQKLTAVDLAARARPEPVWLCDDSRLLVHHEPQAADFVFSCPPYYDLEVYSDDPDDLSNYPSYEEFLVGYGEAIQAACSWLKPNRFAAFVVGDMRDKKTGLYRGFVADTVKAFEAAGLGYYNHAIIAGPAASAALRVGGIFGKGRKLVKTHQDLVVFVKGDGRAAADQIKPYQRVDLGDQVEQARLW